MKKRNFIKLDQNELYNILKVDQSSILSLIDLVSLWISDFSIFAYGVDQNFLNQNKIYL